MKVNDPDWDVFSDFIISTILKVVDVSTYETYVDKNRWDRTKIAPTFTSIDYGHNWEKYILKLIEIREKKGEK